MESRFGVQELQEAQSLGQRYIENARLHGNLTPASSDEEGVRNGRSHSRHSTDEQVERRVARSSSYCLCAEGAACEEVLDVDARIGPLYVREKRVGWARWVHLSERKTLQRWIYNDQEMVEQVLLLGTTLSKGEIASIGSADLQSVSRVVAEMTKSDIMPDSDERDTYVIFKSS